MLPVLPFSHALHDSFPQTSWNWPILHSSHTEEADSSTSKELLNFPPGHGKQPFDFVKNEMPRNFPGSQSSELKPPPYTLLTSAQNTHTSKPKRPIGRVRCPANRN